MKRKQTKAKLVKIAAGPTPERMRQEGGVSFEPLDRNSNDEITEVRWKAKITDKLDWYASRGIIDEPMHDAGKRLSRLYFSSGKVPKTTVMYREMIKRSMTPGDFESHINDYTDSQKALLAALKIVTQDESQVLFSVCALDEFAGGTAVRKRAMITGLAKLAGHWGIVHD